jgi:hypothetical protein
MQKPQYTKEETQKIFKTRVDKIDFTKCPKIRKITTREQFDKASQKVLRALWLQFDYDIEKERDKVPYVGDFVMTSQAKEEFETYYKVFFKSKQFEAVSWDYTLNCEPNIIEEVL